LTVTVEPLDGTDCVPLPQGTIEGARGLEPSPLPVEWARLSPPRPRLRSVLVEKIPLFPLLQLSLEERSLSSAPAADEAMDQDHGSATMSRTDMHRAVRVHSSFWAVVGLRCKSVMSHLTVTAQSYHRALLYPIIGCLLRHPSSAGRRSLSLPHSRSSSLSSGLTAAAKQARTRVSPQPCR